MNLLSSLFKPQPPGGTAERTAVFGDVHSNLEALSAVLADARKIGATRFLCTGDVVGYGADPVECIRLIQETEAAVVKGNHDAYCSGGMIPHDVNPAARKTILWTAEQLSDPDAAWLLNRPMHWQGDDLALAHSSFEPGRSWPYIFNAKNAAPSLQLQPAPLAFFGHTHHPSVFVKTRQGAVLQKNTDKIKIRRNTRYLINPGSVGQPRDRDPRASYAVYDPARRTVQIRRVEYDIETAQKKIHAAGLPSRNADRLRLGR